MDAEGLRRRLERWLLQVWFGEASGLGRVAAIALAPLGVPLSWLVAAVARRRRRRIRRIECGEGVPVIVVGNLVVGGAGKTPIALELARALHARGFSPGLLAGGYRATRDARRTARLVELDTPVETVGDEALLLARESGLPVAAGSDRAAAMRCLLAAHPGVDVVVSDDGLQHRGLARCIEIVVIDARGHGNGRCIPAGPLREPVDRIGSVDLVLLNHGAEDPGATLGVVARRTSRAASEITGLRSLDGARRWTPQAFAAAHRGEALAAVAGIARPERFFDALRAAGLAPSQCLALGDHARLDARTRASIDALDARWILLTGKDAVKFDGADAALRARSLVVEHRAVLEDALLTWLCGRLRPARTGAPAAVE
ncbi:MAG: tetraacyldisaccharide 4'-kinase [Lautropia sp.]